jgi:transcriptional regulator GlxA family with amidase domain
MVKNRVQWMKNQKELAQQADWSAATLAKRCGVSLRTLERYFLKEMGKCPQTWLCEERQRRAIELLRDGCNVKKAATILGYKHATHFSREFKKHWRHAPTENGHDITNKTLKIQLMLETGHRCRDLV